MLYSVELKAIKQKRLPELNDDFAKDAGDYSSLDDLRSKVRSDYAAQKEKAARSEMQSKLVDLIIEDTSFEVPEVLIKEQLEVRLNDTMRALMMRGVHPKTLKLDWELFQERQRERAIHDVKTAIVLERIAKEENLTVSEEEVEEEIARIAQVGDQPVEAVKSRLTKEGGATRINTTIRNRKSLDLIFSLASIKTPQRLVVQP